MKLEVADVIWLDEHVHCSLNELVERSQLPESMLRELLDSGVIEPRDPAARNLIFDGVVMATVLKAGRLHCDFELDAKGIALALVLLRRISELETQVQRLDAATSRA